VFAKVVNSCQDHRSHSIVEALYKELS